MSSPTYPDDQGRAVPKKHHKLKLQPISKDLHLTASTPIHTATPEELAALSAKVAQLASGITEENVQLQKSSNTLELPQSTVGIMPVLDPKQHLENASALSLVRSKLEKLYSHEPDAAEEAIEAYQQGPARTKHQQYMLDLSSSGKSLAQIQIDWHDYYASLPNDQKHEVWQEFYSAHANQSHAYTAADTYQQELPHAATLTPHSPPQSRSSDPRSIAEIKKQLHMRVSANGRLKVKHHVQSLLFGLGLASLVVVLLLFSFFNERFLAPFISPSRQVSATPIVGNTTVVSADPKIIIPKINLEVPVVYGVDTVDEKTVQNSLESGVVHYSSTPSPGQTGNIVIVGHSSNNILNKGKYKFAFVLLKRLEIGDTFSLNKDGVRYTYQVFKKDIVKPTDVSVLGPSSKPNTATLITCDPPGTSLNRLVVVGEQISPDPSGNKQVQEAAPTLTDAGVLPSNAPSLWQRIKDIF
jgi:LPXTG-site transpeptidase (sortase) family protein